MCTPCHSWWHCCCLFILHFYNRPYLCENVSDPLLELAEFFFLPISSAFLLGLTRDILWVGEALITWGDSFGSTYLLGTVMRDRRQPPGFSPGSGPFPAAGPSSEERVALRRRGCYADAVLLITIIPGLSIKGCTSDSLHIINHDYPSLKTCQAIRNHLLTKINSDQPGDYPDFRLEEELVSPK